MVYLPFQQQILKDRPGHLERLQWVKDRKCCGKVHHSYFSYAYILCLMHGSHWSRNMWNDRTGQTYKTFCSGTKNSSHFVIGCWIKYVEIWPEMRLRIFRSRCQRRSQLCSKFILCVCMFSVPSVEPQIYSKSRWFFLQWEDELVKLGCFIDSKRVCGR